MIIGIGASDDVPLSLWDFLEPVSTYDSIASLLLFCTRRNHYPYGDRFSYSEHLSEIDDFKRLWNSHYNEEPVSEQIEWWYCYYWVLLWSGLSSGAIPNHDARQLRRRRLNAPQRREDNSQCSESREWK